MTIKEVLAQLQDHDRATLMYGFENGLCVFVEYAVGKFIGVNTETAPNLKPDSVIGVWSVGTILKGEPNA